MARGGFYSLPELPYGYNALIPHISEEQLRIHHDLHHKGYVNGANAILEKLDRSREKDVDLDMKAMLKELSFHIGGYRLHSIFWSNMISPDRGGGPPKGRIADLITEEFGGFERFKKEFSQVAKSVEGSGWAALTYCRKTKRPIIMQVEKHNLNIYPGYRLLLVLDVWEHAYYLDYKNDRGRFVDAFWNLVNWDDVNSRLDEGI